MTFLEQIKACEHEPWFAEYLYNVMSKKISDTFLLRTIVDTFVWVDSPQGSTYWDDINEILPRINRTTTREAYKILTSTYPKSQFPEYYI